MKPSTICRFAFRLSGLFVMFPLLAGAQIAESYPNDTGIEDDPRVLFVEKFDDGMPDILSRYNEVVNAAGMSLDPDIPPGSAAPTSLKITNIQGINSGGHLYKAFSEGFDSTVFVRYYVKYPSSSNGYFGHEGVWFGGYHPMLTWPYPRAGVCGLGDSRLSIAFENVWTTNPPGMDTYLYWGDMRSWNGGTSCYGNTMVTEGRTGYGNPPSPTAPVCALDEWMCMEIMIKLNHPATDYNGELRIWKNGVEVGYWGPGFPNGHWLKDKWYNDPSGDPFEGFRWRTDPELIINWIWFEYYHPSPDGPDSYLQFANTVMATEYIGPIYDPTQSDRESYPNHRICIMPNPVTDYMTISGLSPVALISLFNLVGRKILDQLPANSTIQVSVESLPPGMYVVKIQEGDEVAFRKIVKRV